MFCNQCGKELSPKSIICEIRGIDQQNRIFEKKTDGVLRWGYEMSMWKNPTIVITLTKVLIISLAFPTLLVFLISLDLGFIEALRCTMQLAAIGTVIIFVIAVIAYITIAVIYGGKYCVIFETDKKGIKHTQMQKQFKKAQILSIVGMMAGAIAGNLTTVGSNMMAGSRNSQYCKFSNIGKIVVKEKRSVIYIRAGLIHSQVYAEPQDFMIVLNHILAHCKNAKVIYKERGHTSAA